MINVFINFTKKLFHTHFQWLQLQGWMQCQYWGGCSVNTDYVKVPIFPRFSYYISRFYVIIRQFDLVKFQLSHGLYSPLSWIVKILVPLNKKYATAKVDIQILTSISRYAFNSFMDFMLCCEAKIFFLIIIIALSSRILD